MKWLKLLTQLLFIKVPEVTLLFWIIKLLTTAAGESISDYLVHSLDPVVAVLLGFVGFCISLFLQLLSKRYIPWIYWLTVTMVAIFGTMAADVLHIGLGIPYWVSTIAFAIGLGIVFFVWNKYEKTLSIHSITTPRRELFYWLTVVTTFALGTAAGDMTAVTFHLGYLGSGILFGILFLLPLFAGKLFRFNEVVTFWTAYIFTRPLGASFADYFGRTKDLGGLGIGTAPTSIVLIVCIIILVGYLSLKNKNS